jgi:hypothetical protein
MTTRTSENNSATGLAWASALGVVVIVLGIFLTAFHSNEAMKQAVLVNYMPESGQLPAAFCPEEELEEEGLSLGECEYMATHVEGLALSTPEWFPAVQIWLAGIGALLAFISVIVGGALVNYKSAANIPAVVVFGGLLLIDAAQFAAVVNTGPILRDIYLWNIMLWILIHLMMLCGIIAGRTISASK